jgi:putative ABC transport system ATP-binding protein
MTTPLAPATAATRVTKVYGHGPGAVRALAEVSLTVRAGEFVAIMGPSGSGKSTLMHCLAGLDTVTSGSVMVGGTDLTTLDDSALTRLRRDRIGFIFQTFNLVPTLDVRENVTLPFLLAGREPNSTESAWVDHLIRTLGLTDRVSHRPSELSGGQQQRVAIARALSTRPVIVFADEPTGNLDSGSSREVLGLLRHLSDDLGQSIVMVTHDPVAASYADRGVMLADGRIVREVAAASPAEISAVMIEMESAR